MQTRKHQEKFKEVMKITHYIPAEIVDLIADYHDYDKYCKPKHQEKFKEVINEIGNMAVIMGPIMPLYAKVMSDALKDKFNRIKSRDIFKELMIKKVNALYYIDRESDTDIAIALEKEICRICKICSHIINK
jgi:hypothetical protein